MAETNIEWTDYTFNPVRGCRKLSAGCANCYAETMSGRNPAVLGEWGPNAKRVQAAESYWKNLAKWNRKAQQEGRVARVFVASLADVFEGEPLPGGREGTDGPRSDYLPMLDRLARETQDLEHLRILVLTKRPGNMAHWAYWKGWPWNWWAGTSVEHQKAADERVPLLCDVPAPVRFLSMEPLLGPVDITPWVIEPDEPCYDPGYFSPPEENEIQWVIVGGESGPRARPMHPDWVRSIRDQCVDAGVPLLFKQWGRWEVASRANSHEWSLMPGPKGDAVWLDRDGATATPSSTGMSSNAVSMVPVGKKAAGRELDGRTWDEAPEVRLGE